MSAIETPRDHCCPYINLDDARCARHFTLGRLERAFSVCVGAYRECPIHDEIREQQARLTIRGRTVPYSRNAATSAG
ncbi:MAG: hypothetical protein R3336_04670 [Phycisphaeraceae bacterium]|nr:hypothetical protein [Phycisphaeraceae bacterium]